MLYRLVIMLLVILRLWFVITWLMQIILVTLVFRSKFRLIVYRFITIISIIPKVPQYPTTIDDRSTTVDHC